MRQSEISRTKGLTPIARRIALLEDYQQYVGIADYNSLSNLEETVYTVSGAYPGNDHMRHGLREWLYQQFARYDIGGLFHVSVIEWLNQPYGEISLQIDIAKKRARDEAKLLAGNDNSPEVLAKELRKK